MRSELRDFFADILKTPVRGGRSLRAATVRRPLLGACCWIAALPEFRIASLRALIWRALWALTNCIIPD
jgi:hypothetical protein